MVGFATTVADNMDRIIRYTKINNTSVTSTTNPYVSPVVPPNSLCDSSS